MDGKIGILKIEAIKAKACSRVVDAINDNLSDEELCDIYKREHKFCCANDLPGKDFIKENFDRELLLNKRIYVDEVGQIKADSEFIIIRGVSDLDITSDGYNVSKIMVCDSSNVRIKVLGHSIVIVVVYNNAKVFVEQIGESKVSIANRGGEGSNIVHKGKIRLI